MTEYNLNDFVLDGQKHHGKYVRIGKVMNVGDSFFITKKKFGKINTVFKNNYPERRFISKRSEGGRRIVVRII